MELKEIEKKIKILNKKLSPLYDKRNKINDEERLIRHKKLLGKCFKFRNGYAGEKWWMYEKVIAYDQESISVLKAQESLERIEIVIEKDNYPGSRFSSPDYGMIEISEKVFNKAIDKIAEKIWREVNG